LQGARASFEEEKKGKIQSGMFADFVILDKNLFEIPKHTIKEVQVVATYLNGTCVYA
jgi:predicted amidohydrolase YtcJ